MNVHARALTAGVLLLFAAATATAGEVKIVLRDGRVTLAADNATVREILAEWARVGKMTLVNADKLGGAPITMQFQDVAEARALESLLRSAGGYILAPRISPVQGESSVERIIIYPVAAPPIASTATPVASSTRPTPRPAQSMPYGRGRGGMPNDDPDDESLVGSSRSAVVGGRQGPGVVTPGVVGGAQGNVVVGRPPEATFDYANPLQLRQALEQAAAEQGGNVVVGGGGAVVGGAQVPGGAPVNPYGTSLVNPYTGQPVVAPETTTPSGSPGVAGGSATRPGVTVPNPASPTQGTTLNPYGLPSGPRPGSVVGPPVEPDRSKYLNPPTPPATATGRGGRGGR